MKNRKGFVMTETLVVVVFLVTIFTFIYVSIIPLLGKYEDAANRNSNIDIVYKLYNIRKMVKKDSNYSTIKESEFTRIDCMDLANTYCSKLMEFLELNNYIIVYADGIVTHLDDFNELNEEMGQYLSKYGNLDGNVIVLYDADAHTTAHLLMS